MIALSDIISMVAQEVPAARRQATNSTCMDNLLKATRQQVVRVNIRVAVHTEEHPIIHMVIKVLQRDRRRLVRPHMVLCMLELTKLALHESLAAMRMVLSVSSTLLR